MIPGTDWFPWENVVEEDRDYGSVCWVWVGPTPPTISSITIFKKVIRLFKEFVPERPKGHLWMHLCERYGEVNLCVRPDHIVVGTKSTNALHWNALRVAAGAPSPQAEGRRGSKHSDKTRTLMSERAKEHKQNEIKAGPYPCPHCGRDFAIPGTRTRHCTKEHA